MCGFFWGGEEGEGAEGPQQGLKGPPALRRSEKEGGRRLPEPSCYIKNIKMYDFLSEKHRNIIQLSGQAKYLALGWTDLDVLVSCYTTAGSRSGQPSV